MKRSTIAKTFTIAAVTAVALGIAPIASAEDKGCSNARLRGTFAYTGTGFIVTPAALAGPFAEVGTQTFDGKGATTTTFTASQNGNVFQTTFTGTYTLNSDCTGTMTLAAPAPSTYSVHVSFAIDDGANGFQSIETDSGLVITRIGKRVFPKEEPFDTSRER